MLSGYDNFFYMDFNNPYSFIVDFAICGRVLDFIIFPEKQRPHLRSL